MITEKQRKREDHTHYVTHTHSCSPAHPPNTHIREQMQLALQHSHPLLQVLFPDF